MPELVKKLKKKYRVALLTNCGKEWLDFKLNKSGLSNVFDLVVSSCHSGLSKPDKRIYRILIKKLGLYPAECVFIDNKEPYLAPAKELGMHTIHFKSQKQLEGELRKMNIAF
jgi:putative hydrolase of the HAD superfamily